MPSSEHLRYGGGGELRKKRRGRKRRPLDPKRPLHVVFKCNRANLRSGLRSPASFALCKRIIRKYAQRFSIRLERWTVQQDHIHLIIHGNHRSQFQYFFRVVAGQIAQELQNKRLAKTLMKTRAPKGPRILRIWRNRPFTCIVHSRKYYLNLIDYLRLNELEALGRIKYQVNRLRDLARNLLYELWSEDENRLRYEE